MDERVKADLIGRLMDVLPDAAGRLDKCIDDHETFRDMCKDYQECAVGLEHWRATPHVHAERIDEYSQLLMDLENEILWFLKEQE